ncbi:hypothetical protein V7201_14880, partial [Bacillus sp. JJ1122]
PVDCSGRRVDSCGRSWSGETPQERSDEEAQRQPRGKRSAWNENQQPCLTEPIKIRKNRIMNKKV